LPGFRTVAEEFHDLMRTVQQKVLRALAMGMPEVPKDFFDAFHEDGENQLRFLHVTFPILMS
jgi:isopenicillin N synthase-like dioxygenase